MDSTKEPLTSDAISTLMWWCPTCNADVHPEAVTYREMHDTRAGGCGERVISERPATPTSNERCNCLSGSYSQNHTYVCLQDQINRARGTADYWKAEHLHTVNHNIELRAEIEQLQLELARQCANVGAMKEENGRLRAKLIEIQRELWGSPGESGEAAHKLACEALDGVPTAETTDWQAEYRKLSGFYARDGAKALVAKYWPDMELVDRPAQETPAYRCEIDGPHQFECKHCHVSVPTAASAITYIAKVEPHHDRLLIGGRMVMIEQVYAALGIERPCEKATTAQFAGIDPGYISQDRFENDDGSEKTDGKQT